MSETIPAAASESASTRAQHTAGPWAVGEYDDSAGYDCMFAGVRCGPVILDGSNYGQRPCTRMSLDARETMMADARLIAAAPDMLANLSEINRLVHQTTPRTEPALHHWQRDFDAIRKLTAAAIAKATGADQ